ncbi:PF13320-domain containing protein [Pelomyxa schiedti]|nr:PF13320-domain containing protein [Pelomyxa schiedti]
MFQRCNRNVVRWLMVLVGVIIIGSCGSPLRPYVWTCDGDGSCQVVREKGCGYDATSDLCLVVSGYANSSSTMVSSQFTVTPLSVYELSFYQKCVFDSESGTATSGVTGVNVDTYEPGEPLSDGWYKYRYLVRVNYKSKTASIRMGQWQINGSCTFNKIELRQSDILPFSFYGYGRLGPGEKIANSVYSSSFDHEISYSSNYRSTISNFSVTYNTDRFIFGSKDFILLKHPLSHNFSGTGNLRVEISYYSSGSLSVYCGADGTPSTLMGTISSKSTKDFPVTDTSCVNFLLIASSSASFQVDQWIFNISLPSSVDITGDQAVLTNDCPPDGTNCTVILAFDHESQNFHNIYSSSTLNLLLKNRGSSETSAFVSATPRDHRATAVVLQGDSAFTISGSSDLPLQVNYTLPGGDDQVIDFKCASNLVLDCDNSYSCSWITFSAVNHLYDPTFGQSITTAVPTGSFWWCDGSYKVSLERSPPVTYSSSVSISAARNEYEPFQLIFHSGNSPSVFSSVTVSDFVSSEDTIDSTEVTMRKVEYVFTAEATDELGVEQEYWPDPLTPLVLPFTCPPNTNCPLWYLVHIPKDTLSGTYSASTHLIVDSTEVTVPLKLRVYNFSIPDHPTLKSSFGLSSDMIKQYHHVSDPDSEQVWNAYLDHFKSHRISPENPIVYHDIWAEVITASNGTEYWEYYLDDFDSNYQTYFGNSGYGFTNYNVYLQGMGSGSFYEREIGEINGHPWGSPEHTALFNDYAKTIENFLYDRGLIPKSIVYWFDEPAPEDYEFVQEGMQAIKDAAPKLDRFLTEEPISDLYGYVDTWCPVISNYDYNKAKPRQDLGEFAWDYVCCCPKAPYLGLFIDHPATEMRLWPWTVWQYKLDGILIWSANYWTSDVAYPTSLQDPYEDPMSWETGYGSVTPTPWGNGDGRLLYPPKNWNETTSPLLTDAPVDSCRLEVLRDGLEDLEYFIVLQDLVNNPALDPSSQLVQDASALLSVPQTIFVDSNGQFTTDASLIYDQRIRIAEMIESLTCALYSCVTKSSSSDTVSVSHSHSLSESDESQLSISQSKSTSNLLSSSQPHSTPTVSESLSLSQSYSHSHPTSQSTSTSEPTSQSHTASQSKSQSQSHSQTQSPSQSKSHSHSESQSESLSTSQAQSHTTSDSQSQSNSHSHSESPSGSFSIVKQSSWQSESSYPSTFSISHSSLSLPSLAAIFVSLFLLFVAV